MHQIELESSHFPITLYPSEHLPRVPAVVIRGRLIPFKTVDITRFDHKPKRRRALSNDAGVPPHPPDTADILALPSTTVIAVSIQIGRRCARPSKPLREIAALSASSTARGAIAHDASVMAKETGISMSHFKTQKAISSSLLPLPALQHASEGGSPHLQAP